MKIFGQKLKPLDRFFYVVLLILIVWSAIDKDWTTVGVGVIVGTIYSLSLDKIKKENDSE